MLKAKILLSNTAKPLFIGKIHSSLAFLHLKSHTAAKMTSNPWLDMSLFTLYLNIFNCLFREQIWVSYPIHPLNPNSFPSIECPYSQCPDPQSSNPAPEKDAEQLKAVATFTLMISLTSTVIGARLKCALSWGNRMHLRTLSWNSGTCHIFLWDGVKADATLGTDIMKPECWAALRRLDCSESEVKEKKLSQQSWNSPTSGLPGILVDYWGECQWLHPCPFLLSFIRLLPESISRWVVGPSLHSCMSATQEDAGMFF